MIQKFLFPFIPILAVFPFYLAMVRYLCGRRSGMDLRVVIFALAFFLWHAFFARAVANAPFAVPALRTGDLFFIFLLLIGMVRNEADALKKLPFSERVRGKSPGRFWIPSLLVFVVTGALQFLCLCRAEPWSYAAAFTAIAAVLYFESVYERCSYYPKLRYRFVFWLWILSVFVELPLFRAVFLFQVAYLFYKNEKNLSEAREHQVKMYGLERELNHKIVSRMSASLHDFSDLNKSITNYLKNLCDGIEAKSAAIYIWDAAQNRYHCLELYGVFFPLVRGNEMSFTHVEALREIAFSQDITDKYNIVWVCGMSREGAHIPYASQDNRILSLGSRAANIQTLILEPLVFDKELLGVLVIENKLYERYFTESDAYLVRNFSHYATMILKAHDVALEKQGQIRTQMELQLGNKIQSGLLPSRIPTFPGISLAGSMDPAKEIGGDYFDFIPLGNSSLGIVVGDVSGKGVPAGMVMTSLYALLHAECRHYLNSYRTLVQVNALLAANIADNMFASMLFFEWNSERKILHYTSCGHEHILHFSVAENKLNCIRSGGIALAMVEDNSKIIKEKSLPVAPGDTVVLYTDGVTESMNPDGAMFGLERLKTFVEMHQSLPAEQIRVDLLETLRTFAHGAPQADDITIIVMKF
jgi:serine phosphatase RsbU (regulator of sigma subunit)